MKLSIVIPTHNRRKSLIRALDSLNAMEQPPDCTVEIIVVASACLDDTIEWANRYSSDLPLRVIVEPRPGVSRAKNRALDVINGDAVIFIDDDVTVASDFASAHSAALARYPGYSIFAGAIITRLEGNPPAAIRDVARVLPTTYSQLWLGATARPLNPAAFETPYGGNMAIRLKALGDLRFDETLGRQGNGGLDGGEEVWLFEQLGKTGALGLWLPDARADHWISASRQNMAYMRRYWRQAGVLQMRMGHYTAENARLPLEQRLRLRLSTWYYRLLNKPDVWLPALRELMLDSGRCSVLRRRETFVTPKG